MPHSPTRIQNATHKPHRIPVQEPSEDGDPLELPIEPDEGVPVIPDDDRVVNVPS
ncbi:hypothetical protein [Polaromonas sp. YR568]|uniref:hypothetical protein n=1 Tax=Polaromonas sp. YR568 TaxID=1855301 RepID=UPI003137E036